MRRTAAVDRFDRFALTLLGLLLLLGGAFAAAVGLGALGRDRADLALVPQSVLDYLAQQHWVLAIAAVAAVLVALLLLRWLLAQLHTQASSDLDLRAEDGRSRTVLDSSAVSDAVEEEVEGFYGVVGAHARLLEQRGERWLQLVVALDERADVGEVVGRLESESVVNLREALEDPGFPVDIRLRPGAVTRAGVR